VVKKIQREPAEPDSKSNGSDPEENHWLKPTTLWNFRTCDPGPSTPAVSPVQRIAIPLTGEQFAGFDFKNAGEKNASSVSSGTCRL
jgi:hypothetical protein